MEEIRNILLAIRRYKWNKYVKSCIRNEGN